MRERTISIPSIIFFGVIFLFFFQLLTDFIGAIYAFGLLGTSVPVEIVAVLLLFAPVVLLFLRAEMPSLALLLLGKAALFLRVVETLLPTKGRMIFAGLGVACFLILLPAILRDRAKRRDHTATLEMGLGLAATLALSVLLRALGSGVDLSTLGVYQLIGWVLAIVAGAAWVFLLVTGDAFVTFDAQEVPDSGAGYGKVALLSLGLMAAFVLFYFAFVSPHVLARWTGVNLFAILAVMGLALSGFTGLATGYKDWLQRLSPSLLLLWNALFVVALALTALLHQTFFPATPDSYPLAQAAAGAAPQISLFITLLLFPILFIDFMLLIDSISENRPSLRELGAGFSLASLFLLIIVLAQVFTTTYAYIPLIGPAFRDRFWLVTLAPGLVLLAAVTPIRQGVGNVFSRPLSPRQAQMVSGFVLACSLLFVLGAWLVGAHPARALPPTNSVKVLTYNVQQGYSEDGQKNLVGQLRLLRLLDADIIGLQETDSARVAGSNDDLVRFFADGLNMYSSYGPKTVNGTFGIALLSKYPIKNPQTYYQFSKYEQVGTIRADISVGEQSHTVFVTHLGNGGPLIQQEQLLQLIADRQSVIAMGDFNFRPNSEQYRRTIAKLADTWTLRWPDWSDDQGHKPDAKIDHIFVTPDIRVLDAAYIEDPASDHPAVMAVLTR